MAHTVGNVGTKVKEGCAGRNQAGEWNGVVADGTSHALSGGGVELIRVSGAETRALADHGYSQGFVSGLANGTSIA